jgi:hypothetical protein
MKTSEFDHVSHTTTELAGTLSPREARTTEGELQGFVMRQALQRTAPERVKTPKRKGPSKPQTEGKETPEKRPVKKDDPTPKTPKSAKPAAIKPFSALEQRLLSSVKALGSKEWCGVLIGALLLVNVNTIMISFLLVCCGVFGVYAATQIYEKHRKEGLILGLVAILWLIHLIFTHGKV